MTRSLILIGFKACGKTTIGSLLAQKLAWPFIDSDRVIEANYVAETGEALTCSQIHRNHGEAFFRALEAKVIAELTASEPKIIATGGGVILDPNNRALLRSLGTVIFLSTEYATLLARLQLGPKPTFISGDLESEFQKLFALREPLYKQSADLIVNTCDAPFEQIADDIIRGRYAE